MKDLKKGLRNLFSDPVFYLLLFVFFFFSSTSPFLNLVGILFLIFSVLSLIAQIIKNRKSNIWFDPRSSIKYTHYFPAQPTTWQGWLIFLVYFGSLSVLLFSFFPFYEQYPYALTILIFLLLGGLSTFSYFLITSKKSEK